MLSNKVLDFIWSFNLHKADVLTDFCVYVTLWKVLLQFYNSPNVCVNRRRNRKPRKKRKAPKRRQ